MLFHGIDAPFVAGSLVMCVFDAIEYGVTHQHVCVSNVNTCTQNFFALFVFTRFHEFGGQ
jgi:hypothetical protein